MTTLLLILLTLSSAPRLLYMHKIQSIFNIIVMGLFMPAALCIYWIATNLFTIVQNLIVKRSKIVNGKA